MTENVGEYIKVVKEFLDKLEKLCNSDNELVKKAARGALAKIVYTIQNEAYMLDKLEIYDKVVKGELPKEEIVKITCYENLGFCCDIERQCTLRDLALEVLGIDKEEFSRKKKEFGEKLVKELASN